MEEPHVAGGGVQRVMEAGPCVGAGRGGGEVDDGKLVDHEIYPQREGPVTPGGGRATREAPQGMRERGRETARKGRRKKRGPLPGERGTVR
ncbi:hypothetical protein GCM10010219_36690 [Streptomyces netropsis]|nr:hypothetical protein GCM10010219_36690 [Streptomyces netropsis]